MYGSFVAVLNGVVKQERETSVCRTNLTATSDTSHQTRTVTTRVVHFPRQLVLFLGLFGQFAFPCEVVKRFQFAWGSRNTRTVPGFRRRNSAAFWTLFSVSWPNAIFSYLCHAMFGNSEIKMQVEEHDNLPNFVLREIFLELSRPASYEIACKLIVRTWQGCRLCRSTGVSIVPQCLFQTPSRGTCMSPTRC